MKAHFRQLAGRLKNVAGRVEESRAELEAAIRSQGSGRAAKARPGARGRRPGLRACLALGVVLGLIGTATVASGAAQRPRRRPAAGARAEKPASSTGLKFRWDIVSYDFTVSPVTVSAGGAASAKASDGSAITLTGSGTFGGGTTKVTGGGAWTTYNRAGGMTGTGKYTVKALAGFFSAPGVFGDTAGRYQLADQIGDSATAHAGLAVLRIAYSDGSQGTLTVSSRQAGTPNSVFMGITATKSFVAYWEVEASKPGVDGDRALFHVLP